MGPCEDEAENESLLYKTDALKTGICSKSCNHFIYTQHEVHKSYFTNAVFINEDDEILKYAIVILLWLDPILMYKLYHQRNGQHLL